MLKEMRDKLSRSKKKDVLRMIENKEDRVIESSDWPRQKEGKLLHKRSPCS